MSGEAQRQANLEAILRPGQIVGERYRVDRLIAEGGMAAVWAGVNERTGKRVALKVILRSFASIGEAAELFRREALAASKVNHPNVVSIFDVIDHEGMTCIVMELLDGETFGNYLARKGPLGLDETVALLLPAMRGVAAANALGVVHRDLKPGNIFLCSDAEGRLLTTKVLDFGVAVTMERSGETSIATERLSMFGTPAYMAPEAIECSPNMDGRTDVYGFGVLFFEALTGELPFPGEPGSALFARILTDPPPKVTEYRPDLPPEVAHIIDCALAKNANDRFPDVEHLIRAIEVQLLPPRPVPRALTPIASTSVPQLVDSNSGAAVPTVRAAHEKEPSDRVHLSETMALYSMASESLRATDRAGVAQGRKPPPATTVDRAPHILTFFRDFCHLLHRRAAVSTAVALFLIVTAWLAVARSSSGRALGNRQLSSSSQLKAASERMRANSRLASTPPRGTQPMASAAQDTADRADTAIPSIRTAAPPPSKRFSPAKTKMRRHTTAASLDRPSAPRAGRLFPSDF